jgi:hypothetical protein
MHQIARSTTAVAELEIYINGQLTNADGGVTVTIVDADYTNVNLITNQTAYNDPKIGKYTFTLDQRVTNLNRVLQVTWSYTLNGLASQQEDFYQVYTPYATVSDIIDTYRYGTRSSDLNYKTEEEIVNAEFIARMQVEAYTSQSFGKNYGHQEVFGNGSDALELTQRMVSIDQVYEDGILVIDYTQNPVYNTFGWNVELTPTNKAIRVVPNSGSIGILNYEPQLEPNIMYSGRFKDASRYMIYGQLGWSYVPQDVRRSTVMLAGDYLAKDSTWRQKYLKKINLSEISFEFAGGAFNGTGNVFVDQILDSYRNIGIVII